VVSNEVDGADCSIFLAVLRVELAELQSRPTLLGACTSCPGLHKKLLSFDLALFRLRLI
jgi:hypothetical protein